jgi:hypothetical protein
LFEKPALLHRGKLPVWRYALQCSHICAASVAGDKTGCQPASDAWRWRKMTVQVILTSSRQSIFTSVVPNEPAVKELL